MSDEQWRERAKCKGDPMQKWETQHLDAWGEDARELKAQSMCSGCPVWRECGAEVVNKTFDTGVVRCFQALDAAAGGRRVRHQYNKIRIMLGIPEVPVEKEVDEDKLKELWPRPCGTCGESMRPRDTKYPEDFPNTVKSYTRSICKDCYINGLKERNRQNVSEEARRVRPASGHLVIRGSRT